MLFLLHKAMVNSITQYLLIRRAAKYPQKSTPGLEADASPATPKHLSSVVAGVTVQIDAYYMVVIALFGAAHAGEETSAQFVKAPPSE
jgi:hypothetical protein